MKFKICYDDGRSGSVFPTLARHAKSLYILCFSQYRFVCEAITSVYKSGRVKPLPKYSKA